MRSRCTAWLPMASSTLVAAIIAIPRLETRDIRFQAGVQRGRSTTSDRFRQKASRVGTGQLATYVVACQVLCISEQFIDLAKAKDPAGSNHGPAGCGTLESPLV